MTNDNAPLLMTETVDIVSAYVSKNSLPAADVPGFIASVHASLTGLGSATAGQAVEEIVARPTAREIVKSVTQDALISFIDGKPYKTLRRHLTTHGMTPETYRARYGLPADYPLVCASYSAARSELAKATGLGQQRRPRAAA